MSAEVIPFPPRPGRPSSNRNPRLPTDAKALAAAFRTGVKCWTCRSRPSAAMLTNVRDVSRVAPGPASRSASMADRGKVNAPWFTWKGCKQQALSEMTRRRGGLHLKARRKRGDSNRLFQEEVLLNRHLPGKAIFGGCTGGYHKH